jgi:hypothetical protein
MEEAAAAERYRTLDLCFAVAAPETEPFLRFLWLRPETRPRLQYFARVALPVVLRNAREEITVPNGIVQEVASAEDQAEALANVRSVARAVVPAVAVYQQATVWLEALLEMENDRRLERLPLAEPLRRDVRACVIAYASVRADLAAGEAAYRRRWAGPGGWTQLGMILDWEFFRRTWEILRRSHSEAGVREVIDQIRRTYGRRRLPEPQDVIASHGV